MNNRAEQFHQDNREMVISLQLKLEKILVELKAGNIISVDDRKELFVLLDCYIEQLKIPKKIAMSNLRRTQPKNVSQFNDSLVVKELENSKTAVELLVKVGREKMIKATAYTTSEAEKLLMGNGYLEEIVSKINGETYYVLSSKGVQSLKHKPELFMNI